MTRILGLVAAVLWATIYRDLLHFKGTNQAELDLIKERGGVQSEVTDFKASRRVEVHFPGAT